MRQEIIDWVLANRIVAIIRGFDPEICIKLADAYYEGGIRMVEVTFPQAHPEDFHKTAEAIRAISDRFAGKVQVGAGTVLTREQLQMARDAGSKYMITPSVNTALIREARGMGLVTMPGAMTPTEAVTAHEAGADFVKIFPAGALGPKYVKDIRAPLSHIRFLAVGGVGPANVADFMKAGCVGAGVGGELTNKEYIAAGAWDRIAAAARTLMENSRV